MANDLNKVQLIGRSGDVIKMHHFDGGGCLGRLSLATNSEYTKKDSGEKVKETEWHQLVFRNKMAEIVEKYVKKGDQIYVEGKIKTRKWQDNQGNDRYSTEINVFNIQLLGSKNNGSGQQQAAQSSSQHQYSPNPLGEDDNDDLPF